MYRPRHLDSHQGHLRPQQDGEMQVEGTLDWIARKGIPVAKLPVLYRLGPAITEALRATGDYPTATSASTAPPMSLLSVFFEQCDSHRSSGREVHTLPIMFAHLVFTICLEVACHTQNYKTLAVMVYYTVQKLFLERHLVESCLACFDSMAAWFGVRINLSNSELDKE